MDNLIFVNLLAGLGAFLIGFKLLSDSIEKLATKKLQRMFNKTANNKLIGVGIGVGTTALIQSSSATTVMVVGFVNAGVMTLFQATTIIMGANIGTTVTAQIVALQSFDIMEYAIGLTAIGMLLNLFFKKEKIKNLGLSIAGLGLVFLGLEVMSGAMESFKENEGILKAFTLVTNPFLLLLLGIGFTALVQSSSAVTSIIISLVGAGVTIGNGGNSILYVILGTNIGTCITAILSAIGANNNAKRTSLIHLMFNTFGAIIFMAILLPWTSFTTNILGKLFKEQTTQIAMFHTFFNVLCTLLFLPFTKYFVKISEIIIKDKKPKSELSTNIDSRMLMFPSIALEQLKKEVLELEKISFTALKLSFNSYIETSNDKEQEILDKMATANRISEEIVKYLIAISAQSVNLKEEKTISNMHKILGDILRVNEIADNFIKYTNAKINNKIELSVTVSLKLKELFLAIESMSELVMNKYFNNEDKLLPQIEEIENMVDIYREKMVSDHIERLNKGECKAESCSVFILAISNLERVADHLNCIAHLT